MTTFTSCTVFTVSDCNPSYACFIHRMQVSRVIRAYEAIKRAEMSGTQPPDISHKDNNISNSSNSHDAADWSTGQYGNDYNEQQNDEQAAGNEGYNSTMPIQPSSALLQEVESWGLFGGAVSLLQQPAMPAQRQPQQQQQQQFLSSSEAAHKAAATAASLLDVRPRLGARLGTAASRPGTACSTTTLHEFDEADIHNADDELTSVMQPVETHEANSAATDTAHNSIHYYMNTNSSGEQMPTVTIEATASPTRESVHSSTTAVQELSPAVVQRSTAAAAPATVTRIGVATAAAAAAASAVVSKGLDVTPGDRLASAASFDNGMSPAVSLQASQRGGSSGGRSVRSVLSDKQGSSGRRIAFEVCVDDSSKDGLELTTLTAVKSTSTTTGAAAEAAAVQLSAAALASPARSSATVFTATTTTTTATMITTSATPERVSDIDQGVTTQYDADMANELPLSADISAVVQSMSAKKRARSPDSSITTVSKKRATATSTAAVKLPVPRVTVAAKPRPEWSIMSYSGDVLATSDGVLHSKDSCDVCDCCSGAVERCTVNDSVSAVRWFETINACLIAASD
jgi:hypothetical protein